MGGPEFMVLRRLIFELLAYVEGEPTWRYLFPRSRLDYVPMEIISEMIGDYKDPETVVIALNYYMTVNY